MKGRCTGAVFCQPFGSRQVEVHWGNIAMAQVSMNTVDIGLPQLAMHSAYETSGVKDTGYLIEASKEFYSCHIKDRRWFI